ncbi:MAG: hypothetical protein M5U35_10485 [Roseovarius sp.]|nr:hypothetical protein [Roseovarius sp.]
MVTDRGRSYSAAMKKIAATDRQTTGRRLNDRAGNSPLPLRRRERTMSRFRRMQSSRKFAAIHSSLFNRLNRERSPYIPAARAARSTSPERTSPAAASRRG